MADAWAVFAEAIPAVAVSALAAFALARRGKGSFFRGRLPDLFTAGLVLIAVGVWLTAYAVAVADVQVHLYGRLVTAIASIPCIGGVILYLRAFDRERVVREQTIGSAKASAAQFEAIVRAAEATGIGIIVADPKEDGSDMIVACNAQAAELVGKSQDDILGKGVAQLLVHQERDLFERLKAKVSSNPRVALSGGFHLLPASPSADAIPIDLGLTQESTTGHTTLGVTLVDARPRRKAIAAAREARSDADFYLDLVTHDLSNFNQGALGYLELLDLNRNAPAEKHARFEVGALRQVRNSARLIENVKLLSVIRESQEPLALVDALHALHDAIDRVVSSWTEKAVDVRLVPTTPAHTVRADPWLRELFSHLLDNAVKFTDGQRVEVAVSVSESADQRSLSFRIADHGRGIPADEREIILDRLASHRRDYAAYRSGIGLFIVKTIADRYGAKLTIEDRVPGEPNKGCVFSLELPRQ